MEHGATTTPWGNALAGYAMPAEWTLHEATWLGWPHLRDDWGSPFAEACVEMAGFCRALLDAGERVRLLVRDAKVEAHARGVIGAPFPAGLELVTMPYGDIWLRDTGPIFMQDPQGHLRAACFRFNGWGDKYLYENDPGLGRRIAELAGVPAQNLDFVLEGGAVEVDGEGTCLTTRQCLLNSNRNGDKTEAELERLLRETFGVRQVVWVTAGLDNDHTDGHIDTLARFVAPGVVLCMEPSDADDPNSAVLGRIRRELEAGRDASGQRLEVVTIPSPGRIEFEGALLAASYANFYIANRAVIMPTYGVPQDERALRALSEIFVDRQVVGQAARAIVTGGGAFHCITQQQPQAAHVVQSDA